VPRASSVARAEGLLVVGLVAFVGVAELAERLFGLEHPVHVGPLAALAGCAAPALLWLAFFYLQDRVEPEPKEFVLGVYLLGAFVAYPVAGFIIGVWPEAATPGQITARALLGAIVPVGLAAELAKYLVVRYSIYLSAEFDEPMDGIVYMTAAGIGYATAENVHVLAAAGSTVYLATGAANVVVTTLAHGCFAGVQGYALGLARFAPPARRAPILLGGLAAAAALNGLFGVLETQVRVAGVAVQPWRGVVFAAVFAAGIFACVFALMRRHVAASPWSGLAGGAGGSHA
jgi:RsiW-degrading membrane proteinase PrsW (M82 family)